MSPKTGSEVDGDDGDDNESDKNVTENSSINYFTKNQTVITIIFTSLHNSVRIVVYHD